MTASQFAYISSLALSHFADRPKQSVSDWCCEHLRFNEPKNNGPFSLSGREYTREILDSWADPAITDAVPIFGSQAGKSTIVMGGSAWTVINNPSRFLWVMPTRDLCRDFSRNRWMTLVRASGVFDDIIPSGARRHEFSTLQQSIGSALVGFAWSNSPTALSSNPCDVVILDEVDKFGEGTKEADSVNLADQRTKNTANPKRIKTTTPTLTDGLGWREFLKTDQRRRFLPCPHCQKFVVLIWSKHFTVFANTPEDAQVRWDPEAKRKDGTWDLDRVERSARFECPHCGGHIQDAHKTKMDRAGEWRPTATAARGYRGWHLPSLYASAKETNVGRLSVKFLQSKQSLEGLQGFINGDLAEPYESQETQGRRVEIVSEAFASQISGQCKIMFVDVQNDGFWFVVQIYGTAEVSQEDGSKQMRTSCHNQDAGHLDTWDDVRAKQLEHSIPDACVVVDSGDKTKGTGDSVYVQCARFSTICPPRAKGSKPTLIGWTPSKGMPGHKRWRNSEGVYVPYYIRAIDPYDGTSRAGAVEIGLFEFSGDFFKDILDSMRKKRGSTVWSVEKAIATEEWWKHLDAEHKAKFFSRKTRRAEEMWIKKSRHWPNHLLDCVVGATAYAAYGGKLKTN